MSWSFGFTCRATLGSYDDAFIDAKNMFLSAMEANGTAVDQPVLDQIDAAKMAARSMIGTGAIGPHSSDLNVVFGGHANPNHLPVNGSSNDFLQVIVSQVT